MSVEKIRDFLHKTSRSRPSFALPVREASNATGSASLTHSAGRVGVFRLPERLSQWHIPDRSGLLAEPVFSRHQSQAL